LFTKLLRGKKRSSGSKGFPLLPRFRLTKTKEVN